MFKAMYHFRKLSNARIFASFLKKKIAEKPALKDRVDVFSALEVNDKMLLKFSEFGLWDMGSELSELTDKLEESFQSLLSQDLEIFKNDSVPFEKMLKICLQMNNQDPGPDGMERLTDSLIYQGCLDFRQLVFFRALKLALDRFLLTASSVDDRRVTRKLKSEFDLKVSLIAESFQTE